MLCRYLLAVEIVCPDLTEPTNGYIIYATDTIALFDYQTAATYSCDDGFGLLGGDLLRSCVGSSSGPGEWSGTAPTCEGKRLVNESLTKSGHYSLPNTS